MSELPKKRGRNAMTDSAKQSRANLFKKVNVKVPVEKPVVEEIKEPIIEQKTEEVMSEKTNDFEVPDFDYSPIAEPVIERSYNETTVISEIGDIPEPDFGDGVPTFEDFNETEEAVEIPKEPSAFENITNPAMSEMDNKDKKMASTQLVNSVLEGYEMLHQLGSKVAKIDEAKIYQKIIDGEIDADIRVPISEDGTDVNAIEYAQSHNSQVESALTYDPEFGEKVKPAMIRVFQKKGWGITDEQYLLGMFGKDLAMKMVLIIGMKKQGNEMIKHFAGASQRYKAETMSEPPIPTYTPDTIQSQSKPEAPIVEMKVETAKVAVTTEELEAQLMED